MEASSPAETEATPEEPRVRSPKEEATAAEIMKRAATSDLDTLFQLGKLHSEILNDEELTQLGNRFVALHREANRDKEDPLATAMEAMVKAREAGFKPRELSGMTIGFVEATSRTLLDKRQIEFPVIVDLDLPVKASKAELDQALTQEVALGTDYLIILDVALAKASRRIPEAQKTRSSQVVGYRNEPNPQYDVAKEEVANARSQLMASEAHALSDTNQVIQCQGGNCFSTVSSNSFLRGLKTSDEKNNLQMAMNRLAGTPMTIEVPVLQNYAYDISKVIGTKAMTVHYYVVDKRRGSYFKSTFDLSERRNFAVAYNVHETDPDRETILASQDTEQTVVDWEEAPASVPLSTLIDHSLKNRSGWQKMANLDALRREILTDRNQALHQVTQATFDDKPQSDSRFNSVVAVLLSGSLGSGFYVLPDVVLTNWHVVDNTQLVEMRLYDGQETFGKVIAKDIRLDLALVKTQNRGTPVSIYRKNSLDLGTTVEAIGHPKGLFFSISRGVVSAIRRQDNINIRGERTSGNGMVTSQGGKPVLYVQTDTPISPGNSGGPLFFGKEVVGVNTWARIDAGSQGLNFSVHYSEVLEFLKQNLAEFK
ncbi:MAG: trypsin-like peptidase domain-containing protein [Magnetococcales bacterium]|nr:trypsin-like peptidase domain-containing protein [Magnetococcales bacterium]MBF0156662.1 trypsin-like peptidase domain-containing protein [Magnetococcales bacterium]